MRLAGDETEDEEVAQWAQQRALFGTAGMTALLVVVHAPGAMKISLVRSCACLLYYVR